jgi:RHS repeat-associated protein
LGSSSYITNLAGTVSQHIEYLPFGELLVDEHLNSHNSPFKFNAKELDPETGNYYYGARYYSPKDNLMLSVDPMYDLYPSFSPYAYTLQNPVRYVDPTGMTPENPGGGCPDPPCNDTNIYPHTAGLQHLDPVVISSQKSTNNSSRSISFSGAMPDWLKYSEQPPIWNSPYKPGELD